MKRAFIVDRGKMAASAAAGVGLLLLAVAMLQIGKWVPALALGLMCAFYFVAAAFFGARVEWDAEGVSQYILGRRVRRFLWTDTAEVGVAGTKVFSSKTGGSPGRMYIYFSKDALDEDKRFEMMLRWPPRKRIFLLYEADRIESLRTVCDKPIETFNVGDLML